MKIPSWFLSNLSASLNAYLHLDDASATRLHALSGTVVTLELLPFHAVFQCEFGPEGVLITEGENKIAVTHIQGTPLQLFGMLISKSERQRFFADDITITGDAQVGQQVIDLFDALEIDWEEQLSRLIGDVPAFHISRYFKNLGNKFSTVKQKFEEDMRDYLHEEKEWFPNQEALHDLFAAIDEVRMEVDRLEAKVQRLKHRFINNEDVK